MNKADSLDEQIGAVGRAWASLDQVGPRMFGTDGTYLVEVFDDHAIASIDSRYFKVGYSRVEDEIVFDPFFEWREVEKEVAWLTKGNALKTIKRTDDELRVANHIVLFEGRDLEGIASDQVNEDGSLGEYFTPETVLESDYTKTGRLLIDWEHGKGKIDHPEAPGRDNVLGYVDWATAKATDLGVWVERVLDRRNEYVKFLEELIDAGLIGNSSEAVGDGIEKGSNGEIAKWPLKRDTLTVNPMEPRMMTANVITALKALELIPELEAAPGEDAVSIEPTAMGESEPAKLQLSLPRDPKAWWAGE